jgi:beta-glucosidase
MEKYKNTALSFEERAVDLIDRMTIEEKCSQLIYESPAIKRLGIESYNWWNECLHGVARAGKATVFPQAIGLAATFNFDLVQEIAEAISDEARVKYRIASENGNRGIYRGLTFWSPNVNIFRDPRWGRGQETYGEDPWLTSRFGERFVKGLQGEHPVYLKTAACAKHFAVHSGPEKLRHEFNALVNSQDLAETYLPAFKALVDVDVESVMGAYNSTNGEPCCTSEYLLENTLRQKWGFKGHVVSDCWAIRDLHEYHKVADGPVEAAALALNSGCDLNCGCTYSQLWIQKALGKGLLTEETINTSLRRLIKTRMKLGMFDPKENIPWSSLPESTIRCDKHRKLAKQSALESVVLLKNTGILPLGKKYKKILLTGPNVGDTKVLLSTYHGISPQLSTILEGISGTAPESLTVNYITGCMLDQNPTVDKDHTAFEAKNSDLIIAVCGLSPYLEGEEGDSIRSEDEGDRIEIGLPENQKNFIKNLAASGTPVVLVLTGGSAIAIPEIDTLVQAVVYCWYPGEAGGEAVAEILFGNENPSGKLPITVPRSLEQLPPFENYSMSGRTYRYMNDSPLYPFGFGLSYTEFSYSDAVMEWNKLNGSASVFISNIGEREGLESVQMYVVPPGFGTKGLPKWSLKGVIKISLNPGESKKVSFPLGEKELSFADKNGEFKMLSGEYTVFIGGSSPCERSLELGATALQKLTFIVKVP